MFQDILVINKNLKIDNVNIVIKFFAIKHVAKL